LTELVPNRAVLVLHHVGDRGRHAAEGELAGVVRLATAGRKESRALERNLAGFLVDSDDLGVELP
jgi:hypothetical protein